MAIRHSPLGTVPADGVLWVETGHPRYHELQVTWRANGVVLPTNNSRSLETRGLAPGTVVSVEVRDPVGPAGTDWVRNPSTGNSPTDSGYNGPRFVQTRQWTLGAPGVVASPPAAQITGSTMTSRWPATRSSSSRRTTRPTGCSTSPGRSTGSPYRTRTTVAGWIWVLCARPMGFIN
jgi:hypothetical protein